MDKYEFNIRVEQIKKLVNKGDFAGAMRIADDIDWRRVRSKSILSTVSSIYERNGEYKEAKDILLLSYEREGKSVSRHLLYKLADLAAKEGNSDEAEEFYQEFCDAAPGDERQFLLRYKILSAKNAPVQQLIRALEEYCNKDLDEKWLYELALLYEKAGMQELCVRCCDKIKLMFGSGGYVDKAMELKRKHMEYSDYLDYDDDEDAYDAYEEESVSEEPAYEPQEEPAQPEYEPVAQEQPAPVEEEAAAQPQEEEEISVYGERQPYRPLRRKEEPAPVEEEPVQQEEENVVNSEEAAQEPEQEMAAESEEPVPEAAVVEEKEQLVAEEEEKTVPAVETVRTDRPKADFASQGNASAAVQPRAMTREDLAARVHEAEVQEQLAKELSRLAKPAFSEESDMAQTRVLKDLRGFQPRSFSAVSGRRAHHMMIECENPQEGFQRAVEELKRVHREFGIKNQAAKITGEKLNKKGVLALADKLTGKDLIIEFAGDMQDEMLQQLDQLMGRDETGMNVVMVDTREQLKAIERQYPGLAKRFNYIGEQEEEDDLDEVDLTMEDEPIAPAPKPAAPIVTPTPAPAAKPQRPVKNVTPQRPVETAKYAPAFDEEDEPTARITDDVPAAKPVKEMRPVPQEEPASRVEDEDLSEEEEMDVDEFANYAKEYASKIDCVIHGDTMLALYERVDFLMADGMRLTKENARQMIEQAADKAEKPSFGKRLKGIFSSKYNKEGLLILKEEHFK